ncbi:MAG TPA: hypothetical protein VF678_08655, partial [bacterium]
MGKIPSDTLNGAFNSPSFVASSATNVESVTAVTSVEQPKLPWLPRQEEVFHAAAPNIVYVKGRRAGGTTGAVLRMIELCRNEPRSRHLWVDTVQRNVDRVVRRYVLPHLGEGEADWLPAKQTLQFKTGAYADFGSVQQPENLEGWGYDYLWVNEAGHALKQPDLYFETLRPMLLDASSAQAYFFGTPKGRGLFQHMYGWGQAGGLPEWKSFHDPSSVNPRLSATQLDDLRRTMPERAYRQEILAEFVDDASQVFRNVESAATATEEQRGRPGTDYVLGVDLARHRDYTAVWVGRVDTQCAVHCDRFTGIPWAQQVARIAALSRRFNQAPAHVDATGVGDAVAESLREAGVSVLPETFTNASKHQMVERMAAAIEGGTFRFAPHDVTQ